MEIPAAQVRELLDGAGAERVGGDAVESLRGALEEVALEVAEEASGTAEREGRSTVTAGDVRRAAGALAVHSVESPLPPEVVPDDVVERHFHLAHDDLDEVIKEHWRGEDRE